MGSPIPIIRNCIKSTVPLVKRALAAIFLAVFVLSNTSSYALAALSMPKGNSTPKVIMLIVNRVNLNDLTNNEYRNIQRLISIGGLGLMTINTGGDFRDMNAYITIGAGDKLIGSAMTGHSYNRDEILRDGFRADQAYLRNTGQNPGSSQVLNISIANSLNANKSKYTLADPGELGAALHEAGLKTAVTGNSDLAPGSEPNRLAPAIAMDEWGRVDEGNISRELLVKDPGYPYGWRTDYGKLEAELNRLLPVADFIVVETGDTVRAHEASSNQLKRMVLYHRTRALEALDRFVGEILPLIDRNTMVMLVTPLPDSQALREGNRVAPVVIAGGGIGPGSVLTSPTTRQSGLVANYDLTATVTDHLKIRSADGLVGIPVKSTIAADSVEFIGTLAKQLSATTVQRSGVLFYFIRYQWVVYTILFILLMTGYLAKAARPVRFLTTGLLLYPFVILLLPLAGSRNTSVTIALSLTCLALLTFIFTRITSDLKLFLAISAANVLPAVADVLTGGYLMSQAALSYDMVVGGRFYGIGNEYMGIVIGAAILGASCLLQLKPGHKTSLVLFCGLIFAGLIFFFAAPTIGSKAGGAITATVGFAVAIYRYLHFKVSLKSVLVLLGALCGGVVILAILNYIFPVGEQSHIGRAFSDLFKGNFGAIWQMILRKATANYYLLQHSPFRTVLLLQLMVWGAIYYRRHNCLVVLDRELPYLRAGMAAMFWGAVAAILLNDSGVIGAPLLLNYLVCPLVIRALKPEDNCENSRE